MIKNLLESVYSQLKKAVSATTLTNIYHHQLPNSELLKQFTVTFELNNILNEKTFDSNQVVREYELRVNINNPVNSDDRIVNNSVFITDCISRLPEVNTNAKSVSILNEELFWDFDLQIYTLAMRFNISYSDVNQ